MEMERKVTSSNQITDGVIWKQLLVFFFPIVLGTFFQQLYNTIDAVVVGQFVGKEALAAVGGPASTIINLLVGFFVGLSSGASVIISQYYGAERADETQKAVHTAMALAIAGGAILMFVGIILAPWALAAMDTPAEIMQYSVVYMRIYFSGTIFSLIYNVGSGILRAVGDSRRPLYFLIVSSLVNVVLDLIFVVGLKWGVVGVGIATVASQVCSAILVMLTLTRTPRVFQVVIKEIRFHRDIFLQIIKIGLPAGLQSVLYSVSNIIIQTSVNSFGTDTVAAWTAYGKIDGIFWMIMSAFGIAITTFAGQNFGAQKYHRLRKSVAVCCGMAFLTSAIISIVLMLAGPHVYQLFTNDANVISIGLRAMDTMVPFYFTYVLIEVLSGAMRGAGESLVPTVITCFGVCVLRVLWIALAVPMNRTIEMVAMSYPITWSVTSVLFLIYYLPGGWLKRCIAKAGFPPEGKTQPQ